MQKLTFGFCALLAACGGGDHAASTSTTGPPGTSQAPSCAASTVHGFAAAPASWAIPAARCQASFDALDGAGGDVRWSMLDLTHDGRADLVVTSDGCDATVGATHWDVYAAGDDGFSAAPAPYAVPAARCMDSFSALAADVDIVYVTMDLDGDGRLDLVVTSDSCDTTVGQTHWDVYRGGASGFDAAPATWAIPAPRCQDAFGRTVADSDIAWATMDLDGDGKNDLVVTSDSCDTTVGQTHWDLYRGGASGFDATPATWTIPAPRCQDDFGRTAADSDIDFVTMDLDGDGKNDLVVTSDSCDATVGTTHWDLYRGGASGFDASPTAFAVPAPRCNENFGATAITGSLSASLLSLTCGAPSFVVTSDSCDATVGQTHWDVYDASKSGFAAAPRAVGVPAPRCQQSFDALASGYLSNVQFGLATLQKAGHPSLVVTSDSCDEDVGVSRWDLYAAQ